VFGVGSDCCGECLGFYFAASVDEVVYGVLVTGDCDVLGDVGAFVEVGDGVVAVAPMSLTPRWWA
jgi:hypothetical protein